MSSGFVPYQIDFSAIAAGKRVSSTKRKIRWRFGYANPEALVDGRNGTDCRGDEHDVTVVWSITSGKRQISMDGREVHYSTNRAGVLEFNWQTKGNHVIKVTGHAAPPMTAQPGFRQYDLSIDGQSFFTMPKVFQLGIKGAVSNTMPGSYRTSYSSPAAARSENLRGDAPLTREQEEADLRRAIEVSINESRQHFGEKTNTAPGSTGTHPSGDDKVNLLGFGDASHHPVASAPAQSDSRSVASYYSAPTTHGQGFQSPPTFSAPQPGAIVPAVAPPGYYQAPPIMTAAPALQPSYTSPVPPTYAPVPIPPIFASPVQQQAYNSPPPVPPAPAPTPAVDVFGLHSAPAQDPFAPKPPPPVTHEDLTNAILASYQSPTPGAAAPQTPMSHNSGAPPTIPTTAHVTEANGVALSMNQLTLTSVEEKPKSEFEKALTNLVNVDHIDEPAEGEIRLTMIRKEQAKKVVKGRSLPKAPVGAGMISSDAPLSKIKMDFKTQENKSFEGIMNAPPVGAFQPNAAQAGALVVHGQGPPPLQQAQGFGVGQMLPNGGFQNQQNLAPGQYVKQQKLY